MHREERLSVQRTKRVRDLGDIVDGYRRVLSFYLNGCEIAPRTQPLSFCYRRPQSNALALCGAALPSIGRFHLGGIEVKQGAPDLTPCR